MRLLLVVAALFSGLCLAAPSPVTAKQLHALTYPNTDGGSFAGSIRLTATGSGTFYNDGGTYNLNITGGGSSDAVTYTTADVQLYFGPTGSDSNACTGTGTAACLTCQGAFNKAPKFLRHQLTVTGAAGNYAGCTISGFVIDPSVQRATAGILLDGALANVTPTTGSATGTATAGSAGSGSAFGTLTNSGATWTVNDAALSGKLVTITGGTGAAQVRVIVSNTATVLTIAGTWATAPDATSAYAIQSPSVNFTSAAALIPLPETGTATAAAGIQILDNVTGASAITLRNIGISIAGSTAVLAVATGSVRLTQVVASGMTTGTSFSSGVATNPTLTACSSASTTGTGLFVNAGTTTTATNSSFVATGTSTGVSIGQGVAGTLLGTNIQATFGVLVGALSRVSLLGINRCDCASGSNSTCVTAGTAVANLGTSGPGVASGATISGALNVANCSYGVSAIGNGTIVSISSTGILSGNALVYGATASHGASITLPTATTTITGATAEMSVDLATYTDTFASLVASYRCLVNLATNSKVCRL